MPMNRFIKAFLTYAVIAAAFPVGAQQTGSGEEDPYFLLADEASKAIDAGDYQQAAERLREAIAMRPDEPQTVLLMSNLGMVYSYMGQDSLAIATFDAALEKAPSMRTVQTNRASILIRNGRAAEAYSDLTKIIEADSANVEARYLHGILSLSLSDLETAEADLRVLADAEPESLRTAACMSALLSALDRHAEATPFLQRLAEQSGEAEDYAALAINYIELGKLTDAGATIAEGLAKHPDSGELYLSRAKLNQARYDYPAAKADARKAESLGIDRSRLRDFK